MPSELDWNVVELPRFAWPGYFAIRPARLVRNRITGSADAQLPLGPILSTPTDLLDQLLAFAELGPEDHLVDLGCGDGRVLVHAGSAFGCRVTGVEKDSRLVVRARARIDSAGLSGRVHVLEADARTFDLSEATVVFLFITAEAVGSVVGGIRSRDFEGTIVSHEQRFVEGPTSPKESTILVGTDSLTVAHRW